MVDTLISTDMNTNLPTHISFAPKFKNQNIHIEDLNTRYKEINSIIHPGFTRVNAAIFLNSPLKNVLLYINKSHNVKLKDNKCLSRINNVEELIKHYRPFSDNVDYEMDFYVPTKYKTDKEIINGVKKHIATKTSILKVDNIKTNSDSIHPSKDYAIDTFNTFNKYCEIFFSNKIKVYTDLGFAKKLKRSFINSTEKLSYSVLNSSSKTHDITPGNDNKEQFGRLYHPEDFDVPEKYKTIYALFYQALSTFKKDDPDYESEINYYNNKTGIYETTINEIDTQKLILKDLVKENNNKGIILIIKKELQPLVKRTYEEVLMCMNPGVPVTRNKDSSFLLLNCNHSFWKTQKNFEERIVNNTFFNI